jgi:hypothetical protein
MSMRAVDAGRWPIRSPPASPASPRTVGRMAGRTVGSRAAIAVGGAPAYALATQLSPGRPSRRHHECASASSV